MKVTAIKKLLWLVFYSLPLIAFVANVAEPRGEIVRAQPLQNFSTPVKVIIHKPYRAQMDRVPSTQALKTYIETQAIKHGVNPDLAIWIVRHESQFDPRAKGDGEASRGLWQISKIYHPEVSDAVAFNVASSTEWSLDRIQAGKVYEWSTYRFCRNLYKDCPF